MSPRRSLLFSLNTLVEVLPVFRSPLVVKPGREGKIVVHQRVKYQLPGHLRHRRGELQPERAFLMLPPRSPALGVRTHKPSSSLLAVATLAPESHASFGDRRLNRSNLNRSLDTKK